MMSKDRSHLTETILNLTLEIMYLLTGEDYIVVKLFGDDVTPGSHPNGEWNRRIQSPIMRSPASSLISEKNHEKKILELTTKMITLLTGEVPIRCQDVAVYLTMEEHEYLEEHKELYKAAMMEKPPSLPSPDFGKASEECLITSPDRDTEEGNVSQDPGEDPADLEVYPEFPRTDLLLDPAVPKEESSPDKSLMVTPYVQHGSPESPEESALATFHTVLPDLQPALHSMDSSPDPSLPRKSSPSRSKTAADGTVNIRFKIYSCSECGKCFPKNAELIRHLRTHTGERPYSCSECNKRFTQNANLIRHQRIHTGVKPYACPECGKRFSGKSDVVRHQKVHLFKKPWPCYECCKSFTRESDFIRHQDSHKLPKRFTCSMCGIVFEKKWLLDRHRKLHTG